MDFSAVTGAYQGLTAAEDILGIVLDAKVDADAKAKLQEAMERLGRVQDALLEVREELFKLQESNSTLKEQLAAVTGWQAAYGVKGNDAAVYACHKCGTHYFKEQECDWCPGVHADKNSL